MSDAWGGSFFSAWGAAWGWAVKSVGGGRKKRRKYELEIDGEVMEVSSLEEAKEILDAIRSKAEQTAKLALERSTKAKRKPTREVIKDALKALQVPEIRVPESLEDYASRMVEQIKAQYESALVSIEIGALLARRDYEIEQDDEEILMML